MAVSMAVATALVPTSASAEPVSPGLATARARAAILNATVDRLRLQAEQSIEAYDTVTDELRQLQARTLNSAQHLADLRTAAATAQARNVARVRLLYQSQADYGLLGALFGGGTPDDLLDRAQVAEAVTGSSRSETATADAGAREGADIAASADAVARRQVRLLGAASEHVSRIQTVLAEAAAVFAGADADVRRIAAADRRAAEAAAARAFAVRLAAAQAAADVVTTPGLPASGVAAGAALTAARTRLGMPYLWGAVGPTRFDCSGLTGWAYRQVGVNLPRTSRQQWFAGPHPTLAELAPGDLLFWATDTRDPATIHHVALYAGGGMMIAAPHSGDVVKVQPVYSNGYLGAVRPTAG